MANKLKPISMILIVHWGELNSRVVLTGPFMRATRRANISSPAVWRDVFKVEKMTATRAVEKGIIDAAYNTVEERVAAAMEPREQLVVEKLEWAGIYRNMRLSILSLCCRILSS